MCVFKLNEDITYSFPHKYSNIKICKYVNCNYHLLCVDAVEINAQNKDIRKLVIKPTSIIRLGSAAICEIYVQISPYCFR